MLNLDIGREVSGEGNGNSLQYSYLGNLTEEPDGLESLGITESDMT